MIWSFRSYSQVECVAAWAAVQRCLLLSRLTHPQQRVHQWWIWNSRVFVMLRWEREHVDVFQPCNLDLLSRFDPKRWCYNPDNRKKHCEHLKKLQQKKCFLLSGLWLLLGETSSASREFSQTNQTSLMKNNRHGAQISSGIVPCGLHLNTTIKPLSRSGF